MIEYVGGKKWLGCCSKVDKWINEYDGPKLYVSQISLRTTASL